MAIIKLNYDQIRLVVGGVVTGVIPNRIAGEDRLRGAFMDIGICEGQVYHCLFIMLCGDSCIARCIPDKKPEKCSYESWGIIHNLDEGTLKKCSALDPSKVIK